MAIQKRDVVTTYRIDATQAIAALRSLQRTGAASAKSLSAIERSSRATSKSVSMLAGQFNTLMSVFKIYAGTNIAYEFVKMSDAAQDVSSRLAGLAGSFESSASAADVGKAIFRDLLDIALQTGIGIEGLASSYQKLGVAVPTAEHEDLAGALNLVSNILAKTGATTQQANAVLLQLSQALGSGALQGDEFRSVFENAPVLLRAWQEAAGLTGQSLRDLSSSAALTTESFFKHREEIQRVAEEQVKLGQVPITVGRAFENLRSSIVSLFVEARGTEGVFGEMGQAINQVALNMDKATPYAIGLVNALSAIGGVIMDSFGAVGRILGAFVNGLADLSNALFGTKADASDVGDFISYMFEVILPTAITAFGAVISNTVTEAIGTFKIFAAAVPDLLETIPAGAKAAMGMFLNTIIEYLNRGLEAFVDFGTRAGNFLLDKLNNIPLVPDFKIPDVNVPDIPLVPVDTSAYKDLSMVLSDVDQQMRQLQQATTDNTRTTIENAQASAENARMKREQSTEAEIGARIFDKQADSLNKTGKAAGAAAKGMKDVKTEAEKAAEAVQKYLDAVIPAFDAHHKISKQQVETLRNWMPAFEAAEKFTGVSKELLIAVAKQESGFNAMARSHAGAKGAMQFMDGTAKMVAEELRGLGFAGMTATKIQTDHNAAILAGAFHLRQLYKEFGSWEKALAGYNAGRGEANNFKNGVHAFKETRNYIATIIPLAKALTAQTADLDTVTKQYGETGKDATEKTKKGIEDVAYEIKTLEELMLEAGKSAVSSFQSAFADTIKGFFTDGIGSAKEFMSRIGDIILSGFANIVSTLATQKFVVPIVAAVTGGAVGTAQAGGVDVAGGGGGLISGIANIFTSPSIGTTLGVNVAKAFGMVMGTNAPKWLGGAVANLAQTPNWALGVGAIGGGLAGNLLFGNKGYGSVGSGIGSSVGAAVGSAMLPVVGTIIGGLIGGAGGGFLGSLFGKKKEKPPMISFDAVGGNLRMLNTRGVDSAALQEAQQYLRQVNSTLSELAKVMGPEAEAALRGTYGNYTRGAPENFEAMVQGYMERTIKAMAGQLEGIASDIWKQTGGDLAAFSRGMETLAATMEGLKSIVSANPTKEALDQIQAAEIGITGTMRKLSEEIMRLGNPQTVADLDTLSNKVQQRYQLELQMLGQVYAAIKTISANADAARESIRLANATEQQIYEYRRNQTNDLVAQLENATDPAQILELSNKAMESLMAAFNALPASEQQLLQQDFLGMVDYIESMANDRLEAAAEKSEEEFKLMQEHLNAQLFNNEISNEVLNETRITNSLLQELIASGRGYM